MSRFVPNIESGLLLACVRACVNPDASDDVLDCLRADLDWNAFIRLARDHNTLPLAAAILTRPPCADHLPDEARNSLRTVTYTAVRGHFDYRVGLLSVLDALYRSETPTILLKGSSLAESVYPRPHMRLSADIDVMVRPSDLVAAARTIMSLGYHLEHHLPAEVDELGGAGLSRLSNGGHDIKSAKYTRWHDYHLSLAPDRKAGAPMVELHWKPAPARSLVVPVNELWESATTIHIEERTVMVLAPEHQIVLIVFHALNHGWAEGTLRSLLDLSLIAARRPDLDWDLVVRTATSQRARGHAYHVLEWAREHLGAPIPDEVVAALRPTDYERWSSKPMRSFQEVLALSPTPGWSARLRDIADAISEAKSPAAKLGFLMGVLIPPASGLAQMRGSRLGWRLYLSYPIRPILAVWRAIRTPTPRMPSSQVCAEEPKPRLADRSAILRSVERLNERATAARSRGIVGRSLGRAVNSAYARGFDLYAWMLLLIRRLVVRGDLLDRARALADGSSTDESKVRVLCEFVFRTIRYARSTAWLKPIDVLRLGFGDCRCQAMLLRELLRASGVEARIAVGIVRRRQGHESAHTWVEVSLGEHRVICDPTLSPHAMSPREFDHRVSGVIDVTSEYAQKRPDLGLSSRPF